MKKKFTDIISKAGTEYSLSADERAKMTRVVREYIAHKPLRSAPVYSISVSYRWFSFAHRPLAAALVLVLIFGSGISYAAEGSLPGDALYTVKTYINEPTRVALATGAEAKAEVQIELAERRIEEAAVLAAEGRLDEGTQESLAIAFESHAGNAAQEIEDIESEDSSAATELSSRFETRLAAHEDVLAQVRADLDDDSTRGISVAIRGAGLAVASIRTRAENRGAVSADAPSEDSGVMAATLAIDAGAETAHTTEEEQAIPDDRTAKRMRDAAEKQLKTAKKKVHSADLSDEMRAEAEAELEYAESLIENGHYLFDEESVALAFHAFQESLVISEKIQVMTKAEPALAKARESRSSARSASVRDSIKANGRADTSLEARIMAPAFETETTLQVEDEAATSRSFKFIPPSIQIFPTKDDREEEEDEDTSNDGSGEIKIDLPL